MRANLRLALTKGRFDVVHGFEPGLPSLSYLALTSANALTAATFFSADRLGYPARRSRRDRLRVRVDALLATSEETADAASRALRGRLPPRADRRRHRDASTPAKKRRHRARAGAGRDARRHARSCDCSRDCPGWELAPPPHEAARLPARDPARGSRTRHVRSVRRTRAARRRALGEAAIFAAAPGGEERLALEAAASGAAIVGAEPATTWRTRSSGSRATPTRGRARAPGDGRSAREAELRRASPQELDDVYSRLDAEAAPARRARTRTPLADRDWIAVDLHMHTNWSHDCSIPAGDLLDHAEAIGLGGIAVTDHNVFGGALEAVGARRATATSSSSRARRSRPTTRAR